MRLLGAGIDARTITDALGQSSEQMARHYSRDAGLRIKMHLVAVSSPT